MTSTHCSHGMTDTMWEAICPLLPGQRGQWGGIAQDNRLFVDAVFQILRTGAPWRDLPPEYGKWGTVYQRFRRWRDHGVWEKILEQLMDTSDFEWLLADIGQAGERGGGRGAARPPRDPAPKYVWPWIRMVCRSEYLAQQLPLRMMRKLLD